MKLFTGLVFGLFCAQTAVALPLYTGSIGTKPSAQGWTYGGVGFASEAIVNNSVVLDTRTIGDATQIGYARILPAINSTTGFTLSFTAQLFNESHNGNDNRAGFSVILLDSAHQGVELGFWTNQIFAQSIAFTRAEVAAFDTTTITDYRLSFFSGNYTLYANGSTNPLLSGSMRDYSVSNIPTYLTDNFIFFGDDTRSAQARVGIASVSVADAPEPPTWALLFAPVLAAPTKARRLRRRINPARGPAPM
jgi:hypothetical protein